MCVHGVHTFANALANLHENGAEQSGSCAWCVAAQRKLAVQIYIFRCSLMAGFLFGGRGL